MTRDEIVAFFADTDQGYARSKGSEGKGFWQDLLSFAIEQEVGKYRLIGDKEVLLLSYETDGWSTTAVFSMDNTLFSITGDSSSWDESYIEFTEPNQIKLVTATNKVVTVYVPVLDSWE